MCRLLAYYGDPILLASSVLWPERSIIKQSYDARERLLDPSLPAHLGMCLASLHHSMLCAQNNAYSARM